MCTAGDLSKVRSGSEQDRAKEEKVILIRVRQEPRLGTGAYSYLFILVLFHISLPSSVD